MTKNKHAHIGQKTIKNFFKSWKTLRFTIYTFPYLRGGSWRVFYEEMTNN